MEINGQPAHGAVGYDTLGLSPEIMRALNKKGYHPAHITDAEKCIACAMCATMCPDVVITVEKI